MAFTLYESILILVLRRPVPVRGLGRSALEVGVVTPYILRATSILARSPLPPYPTGVYNL